MKYAIIIPDGAADRPARALVDRTPLEVARLPHMNRIAAEGRLGTVQTVPAGLSPGSDVAILSLLGYDPTKHYTGRAPLEAVARGIELGPDDWVFRCNFVTVAEEEMMDYSAGHIRTQEAQVLIAALEERFGSDSLRFYAGVGYRHLVVIKGERFGVRTTPPHDIMGQPIKRHLPKGKNAARLKELMHASREVLATHPINTVRRDLGENLATQVWLWGEGQRPTLDSFYERWNLRGAAITAVDLVRGIAKLIGWDVIEVEGATGYYDTNYAGKAAAAIAALKDHDLVVVHVEAPDEAGHAADIKAKLHAIEQIDEHVVGPVLARLREEKAGWRILVLPDHPTPVSVRTHTAEPVPFAIAGERIEGVLKGPFHEKTAAAGDLHIERGHELMEFFLKAR